MSSVPSLHRISAAIGVLILLSGIVVVVQPSLASTVPLSSVFLPVIALLALALGLWQVRVRNNEGLEHTQVPTPEFPFSLPTPGDEMDEMIFRYTNRGEAALENPQRIGERLREVAIDAITHRENCTREEALDRLEAGSWTDNQYAQAFFSGDISAPTPSLSERIRRSLGGGGSAYERQVSETVDAIVAVAELVEDPKNRGAQDHDGSFLDRLRQRSSDSSPGQAEAATDHELLQEYTNDEGELVAEGVSYRETLWTGRWTGVGAFALVAAAVGVAALEPGLVLAGSIAVAYAAYARTGSDTQLANLSVERYIDEQTPAPGDEVEVTVTVENEGGAFLPDIRIVDLVPANMRVIDGSSRLCTALRPGASVTFTYTIIAERGQYDWPLLAIGSGFSASVERTAIFEVDGAITCLPSLQTVSEVPVRSQTTVYSGQVDTKIGGAGLEFFSVRDYRPGDPMNRIDWKRHARTGELATVNFREERAATVVLLFDARESAYVADGPGRRHALDRAVDVASEVYAALADGGNLVGIAAFDTVPCWLSPSAGDEHDERVRQIFAYHPAISSLPPDMLDIEGGYVDPMTHVRRQLPSSTQIMMFSPLNSEYPAEVARQLNSAGHLVTVVSPDPTSDRTTGQRLARVERATRVNRLRERGIRVLDWGSDEPLGLTLRRANRRWPA